MTEIQKRKITEMRRRACTYTEISDVMGISVGALKSFCRRYAVDTVSDVCLMCGQKLRQVPHKRKKKFCSDKCRLDWWRDNRDAMNRKAVYHFSCKQCGKEFECYGNSHRIYCSRRCYADARRKLTP